MGRPWLLSISKEVNDMKAKAVFGICALTISPLLVGCAAETAADTAEGATLATVDQASTTSSIYMVRTFRNGKLVSQSTSSSQAQTMAAQMGFPYEIIDNYQGAGANVGWVWLSWAGKPSDLSADGYLYGMSGRIPYPNDPNNSFTLTRKDFNTWVASASWGGPGYSGGQEAYYTITSL